MKHRIAGLLLMVATTPGCYGQALKLAPDNIDRIVKEMTPDEKVQLVIGFTMGNSYFGLPSSTSADAKDIVPGAAGMTAAIERLGIPHTVVADGPAGLRINPKRKGDTKTYYCTAFPTGVTLACTWDENLVKDVTTAMGEEVLEYGCDVLLAPGMNIHRNPLCGRNFEYFSEDPLLAGKMAAAYVNGVQSRGVGVSVKHFAGNNQESNRMGNDAVISQRALREIYLKPFEIVVREASPWTVMSSYNKINGDFTQESRDLLTTILRDEWGYDGIVMTDWTNTRNTARQIAAGNDLMMPGNRAQIDDLTDALNTGRLSMDDLDTCVKRVIEYIVKTPRFRGYAYTDAPDLASHAKVTRQAAADGMVLCKNSCSTLPLKKGGNVALFGITSYDFISGGTGSGDVNEAYTVGLNEGLAGAGFNIDKHLANVYKDYLTLQDDNKKLRGDTLWNFFAASRPAELELGERELAACAQNNDFAIITLGRNAGEGADRYLSDFNITPAEMSLIKGVSKAFHALDKKVIVVVNTGGVIETASWKSLPDAILVAWQPGQEGGNSVVDILVGDVNPSGRFAMTWPMSYDDHYSARNFPRDFDYRSDWFLNDEQREKMANIGTTKYEEDVYVGYRFFDTAGVDVSYPFGYGLSYTTFDYSTPRLTSKKGENTVKLNVTNSGDRAGREVVQLYVHAPKSDVSRPNRELKAFAKTPVLQPGESCEVTLTFKDGDLAYYDDVNDAWVTVPGTYRALIGGSSADVRTTVDFNVKGGSVKCNDALPVKKELKTLKL